MVIVGQFNEKAGRLIFALAPPLRARDKLGWKRPKADPSFMEFIASAIDAGKPLPQARRGGPRLLCLAVALVTLLVYLPVRRHGFILYDDPDYITENPTVQAGLTLAGLKWAFTTLHASNWHPLTWLSHMVDCESFDLDPGAHHLVSVLFHAGNSALLLLLLFRLTGAPWASAFVACCFAWHPLHVESVAWVAERKDVLSTMFWLLALLAYVRYVKETERSSQEAADKVQSQKSRIQKAVSPGVSGSVLEKAGRFYLLAVLCFALGLMCKPMLVTVPFTLLLLDYWPLRRVPGSGKRTWPQLAIEKWPFFLLTVASCAITFLAQRSEAVVGLAPYPLPWRVGNALVSYVRYLCKTVWPVNLAVIYPLPHGWPWSMVIPAAGLLIVMSWSFWRMRRTKPHLFFGWFWFLGTLLPVIGLVQVGGQAMADRYTYVPLIGLFMGLTFEAAVWLQRWNIGRTDTMLASLLLLSAMIAVTENQLKCWTDSRSLFAHAIAVTPNNAIAHVDLGVALEESGRRDDALKEYQKAVHLNADLVQARNNLGNLFQQMGKTNEALAEYQAALRLKPEAPLVHANLGGLLLKLGRSNEAMDQLSEAARLAPQDPRYHYLLAKAFLRQGQNAEAAQHFATALSRQPNDVKSLVYLARLLAADVDPRVRNGAKAVELAELANKLTEAKQPFVLDTLAMAYAESGRFPEALLTIQHAIAQAKSDSDTEGLTAMRARLQLYKSGLPYREALTNALPEQIVK